MATVSSFGIEFAPKCKGDFKIVRIVTFWKGNEFKKITPGAGNSGHEIRNKIGDEINQIRRIEMIIESRAPGKS